VSEIDGNKYSQLKSLADNNGLLFHLLY